MNQKQHTAVNAIRTQAPRWALVAVLNVMNIFMVIAVLRLLLSSTNSITWSSTSTLTLAAIFISGVNFLTCWKIPSTLEKRGRSIQNNFHKEREISHNEQSKAEDELRESRELFTSFMNNCPAIAFMKDEAGRLLYINPLFEKIFGFKSRDWHLKTDVELWGERTGQILRANDVIILAGGKPVAVEEEIPQNGHVQTWLSFKFPIQRVSGEKLLAGMAVEITDRTRLLVEAQEARVEAEAGRQRFAFLSEASKTLSKSLEIEAVTAALVRLSRPLLADWTLVVLLNETTGNLQVTAAHGVPLDQLKDCQFDLQCCTGIPGALSAGMTMTGSDLSALGFAGEKELVIIRSLGMRSFLAVPLVVREKTTGVILFASSRILNHNEDRHDSKGRLLAEELVHRAAIAIDNARLYQAAQSAIRLRDEFISIASHELRTPLTSLRLQGFAVKMMTDQILAVQPAAESKETFEQFEMLFEIFQKQVNRLSGLIDDLLDVSRISAGPLKLNLGKCDLGKIVEEVLHRFSPEANEAKCMISVQIDAPTQGYWDLGRIDQVVVNLVSNAIKYGRGKPIEISVSGVGSRARLLVKDHGIGILAQDQKRIFERFERAASPRHYGGLGLGLHIASQITQAHGGSISVVSALEQGATFTVELPLI